MFASLAPLDSPTLAGRFVRLEPLSQQHLEGLVAAADVPRETFNWVTLPTGPAAMQRYLDATLAVARAGAAVPFATLDASSGRVIGCTRFANLEHQQLPSAQGDTSVRPFVVEIGWTWLTPAAQRTGINTEAKLLMLGHAFEEWRVARVILKTHEQNARSRAAIERIGGTYDGARGVYLGDGSLRPTAWYSLGAGEWPANKARLEQKLRR